MTTFSIKGLNKERLAEKILQATRGNSTPEQSETDETIALIETLEERAGNDRIHGDKEGVLMSCAYGLALEQLQETEDKLCEANLTIDRYAREAALLPEKMPTFSMENPENLSIAEIRRRAYLGGYRNGAKVRASAMTPENYQRLCSDLLEAYDHDHSHEETDRFLTLRGYTTLQRELLGYPEPWDRDGAWNVPEYKYPEEID